MPSIFRAPHFSKRETQTRAAGYAAAIAIVSGMPLGILEIAGPGSTDLTIQADFEYVFIRTTQTPQSFGSPVTLIGEPPPPKPFLLDLWPQPPPDKRQTPFQLGMPLAILEDAGEKPFLQSDWITPPPVVIQEPDNRGSFATLKAVPEPFA